MRTRALRQSRFQRKTYRAFRLRGQPPAAGEIWFGYRPESVGFIRDLLEIFQTFVGASVGYEPNADFNDAKTERGLKNLRDAVDVSEGGGIDAYGLKTNPTKVSVDEWARQNRGREVSRVLGKGRAPCLVDRALARHRNFDVLCGA